MDPALRKEKEAFKRKALAAAEKSQKSREAAAKAKESFQPTQAKKPKKKQAQASESVGFRENLDLIKSAAQSAHRSNTPHRLLKSIMDMLKQRYISKHYEPITLEEIFVAVELTELKPDMKHWIRDALTSNPKVEFYPEEERYLFKPALGHGVCNRKQLLERLRTNELKGLGGIAVSDIKEAVHNHEKTLKRLMEDKKIICISRQDKEQVIFYNNPDYSLGHTVSEEFQAMWHCVSVEGMTEADVEKYLGNVGLGAMQGEGRKRKIPGQHNKKTQKKPKLTKVMNTHLDDELLKNYSADADK